MEYLAEEQDVSLTRISRMSRRISLWKDLASFVRLCRIFRRERPQIVHTHTAKAGTLGRLAAMCMRVPIRIHVFHGHVFRGYFSPPTTKVVIAIERWLARHTDCIIALSEAQRHELVEIFHIAAAERPQSFRSDLLWSGISMLAYRSRILRAGTNLRLSAGSAV